MSTAVRDRSPAVRRGNRFGFLIRPGWIGAIVGALAFTAACWLILAPWQFGRNAETQATNDGIDAALHATPVPVQQYLSTDREPEAVATWKPVTATGVFDQDHVYYVRLRQDDQGNPVSEVVLPMRLTDGTVLLVDRGYRSFGDIKANLPLPPAPTGTVTVTGRVQQDQTDPRHRQPAFVANLNQAWAVDADTLAGAVGTPGTAGSGNILQGYIQLMAGSPGVLEEIGMPQTDSGPYLSYALQWCAFGGMSLLAIAYFIFREVTDPRGPDERDVAYPERTRYPDEIGLPGDVDGPDPGPPGPLVPVGPVARDPDPDSVPQAAAGLGVTAGVVAGRGGTAKRKRPSRDGFDRSQLFD